MGKFTTRLLAVLVGAAAVAYALLRHAGNFDPPLCVLTYRQVGCGTVTFDGYTRQSHNALRAAFLDQFETGRSLGAQFVMYEEEDLVVDLAGSYREPNYDADSLQVVFSSSKVFAAIVFVLLQDRGLISYEAPVAQYWPEFAKNGKGKILIKDVLRHEAGLTRFNDLLPWELVVKPWGSERTLAHHIEEARPAFANDSRRAYHAITQGWIQNEIVRRVDPKGRSIGRIMAEDIAGPLDADFYFGLPPRLYDRVHNMTQWHTSQTVVKVLLPFLYGALEDKLLARVLTEMARDEEGHASRGLSPFVLPPGVRKGGCEHANLPETLATEGPSFLGVASARGMGKILAMMANGGELEGKRILSAKAIERALKLSKGALALDITVGNTTITDGGFTLDAYERAVGTQGWYGWGGWGGSSAHFNPDLKLAYAYCGNGMGANVLADERLFPIGKVLKRLYR